MLKSATIKLLTSSIAENTLGKVFRNFVPVFVLHRVYEREGNDLDGHSAGYIKSCLEYLNKRKYKVLGLEDLCRNIQNSEPLPDKTVVFTIDDGFKDQIELGGKLFSDFDVPLLCFVVTDFIDQKVWPWDDQIHYILHETQKPNMLVKYETGETQNISLGSDSERRAAVRIVRNYLKKIDQNCLYPWVESFYENAGLEVPKNIPNIHLPATWESLNAFVKQGHSVAAHTCSHRILSKLSKEESMREIVDSIDRVNLCVSGASSVFAYPTGRLQDFGEREMTLLQQKGITGAVTTEAKAVTSASTLYSIPRYPLPHKFEYFKQYVGYFEQLKNLLRRL